MIEEEKIGKFLDDFASDKHTPGGGSAAALSGALGAASTCMVASLTVGKDDYADVKEKMEELIADTTELKDDYLELVDKDMEVFNDFMEALKLPKETEEEKEKRAEALKEASIEATEVPFAMAKKSLEVLKQALIAAKKGNIQAVSDAGVGAIEAWAALEAAELNVNINLASMNNEEYVAKKRQEMKELKEEAKELKEEVLEITNEKIG
ncbi:cyclodeaminase/cyclohydrolase family protein [Acetohalobium arabaticum]|uniref:Methenyltetrahydrofolate cyclohydrolase n=1 Tax=Acetohalobium arabaticum (strain ATCC 49924 / DSM 5501 / Z-7288) TaxID=574087 RepID=D9QQ41_ACEAZ|nr:cyclodeaminase/cyclohydrolase family protein [Acetohalobium arabaticum]ADL12632.1 Methenyltetrahydrofolate cyclohydrolase [Acetohalobium arabaticum DSM 5501]